MSVKSDMMEIIDQATTQKTSAYDSTAEVTRVEGDTIWVHLAGGVTETPVRKTINARPGDTVQVRVSGGRAWIQGNETNPPTDDTAANKAAADAVRANAAAQSAVQSATTASAAASQAVETANSVRGIAEEAAADAADAQTSAEQAATAAATADSKATAAGTAAAAAQTSADQAASAAATADSKADAASAAATRAETKADTASAAASRAETAAGNAESAAASAQESADGALVGLSTVQDVVGVLNWITAHGTMTSQSGGTFDADQVYFIQDNNGDYTVGGVRYSLVAEPKASDINSYYVLAVDASVQNYIASHIALTNEGLVVTKDNTKWKVLIKDDGVYIIDNTSGLNKVVAQYKDTVVLGANENGKTRTELSSNGMKIIKKVSSVDKTLMNVTADGIYTYGNSTNFYSLLSSNKFLIQSQRYITGYGNSYKNVLDVGIWNEESESSETIDYIVGSETATTQVIASGGSYTGNITVNGRVDPHFFCGFINHRNGELYIIPEQGSGYGYVSYSYDSTNRQTTLTVRITNAPIGGVGIGVIYKTISSTASALTGAHAEIGAYPEYGLTRRFAVGNGNIGYPHNALSVDDDGNLVAGGTITDGQGNVLGAGGKQQCWYGTSNTGASTARKEVTTTTGNFEFTAGNVLYVRFRYANETYGSMKVTVDGTTKDLYFANSQSATDYWSAYETLALVYNGVAFYAVNQGKATTSYYGMTKLEDSVNSTSTTTSATPNSVKTVMDAIPEIAKGRTGSISCNANSYKDATVTFDTEFSAVPNVVVSIYSTSTAGAIGSLTASALNVTTTGFKVRVFNAGSAQRSPAVDWIAIN